MRLDKSTSLRGGAKRVKSELIGTRFRVRYGDRACSSFRRGSPLAGVALGARPDAFSSSRGLQKPV